MGERYYITGVQLGMIKAFAELGETVEIEKLIEKIEDNQFVGRKEGVKPLTITI